MANRHFVLTRTVLLAHLGDGHAHRTKLFDDALDEDPLRGKTSLTEHPRSVDRSVLEVSTVLFKGMKQVELRLERHLCRVAEIPQFVDRHRQSRPRTAFPDRAVAGTHPGVAADRSRKSRED